MSSTHKTGFKTGTTLPHIQMDATGKKNIWKNNISSAKQMGVYVDNAVKFLRWTVMRSYLRPP